jgi:phosphatidylglycerol:prolipoprotein diacylglycerol transferase
MSAPLIFPQIDPVAFAIGPFAVRWYALAYVAGLVGGWQLAARLARGGSGRVTPGDIDDFLTWATLGVILGGRIGYVLFYNLPVYLDHPLEALAVWKGGMSFHGGFLGVVVAVLLYARHRKIPPLCLGDLLVTVAPIGLFLGRLANFVNGELFGRIAPDAPFAMIFPHGGPLPRHPSQLYQAGMEGILLFASCFPPGRWEADADPASSSVCSCADTASPASSARCSANPTRSWVSCSAARPWGNFFPCRWSPWALG